MLVIFIFTITACSTSKINKPQEKPVVQETVEKELSLEIVATNKLLYNMVKDIVGDRHNVDYMFTNRERLWNFNYSEDSIGSISKKDLFFYWGSGIEPWAADFVGKLSKSKVGAVSISRGVKLLELDKKLVYKDTTITDNPYYWMNIDDYKIAMLNIKNTIQDKDSKDRDLYEKNFTKAIKEVEEYQKKLKEAANKLKDYTFLVDGDELDYFTEYYGFKTLKIHNYGLTAEENNTEENQKVDEKLKEAKNVVFLYDEEGKLKSNEALINKYNMKTLKILVYKDDIRYTYILSNNLTSLESLAVQQ